MNEQLFSQPDADGDAASSGEDGYRVIARRYRPSTFDDVIGQEHVTRTLKNAIREDRLGHAYLFSGPRGIGKTSTARILARAINCERGMSPDPCNDCSVCRELEIGSTPDIVEIDAASQRGIDDIRNLRETVRYTPLNSEYRVYIIDEAHMLSKDAFNAFLKTLEEPPEHVVFVFATTEPQKMPDTIISRCQPFQFKRIPHEEMLDRLTSITENEEVSVRESILSSICRVVDGSLRDAQSILDQLISISGDTIEERDLKLVLGTVPSEVLNRVLDGIKRNDPQQVLEQIHEVYSGGGEIDVFLDQFISHLRDLLVVTSCGAETPLIDVSDPNRQRLSEQAKGFSRERIAEMIEALVDTRSRTDNLYQSRILLETSLVRLCVRGDNGEAPDPDSSPDSDDATGPSGGSPSSTADRSDPNGSNSPDGGARSRDGGGEEANRAEGNNSKRERNVDAEPEPEANQEDDSDDDGADPPSPPASLEAVRDQWNQVVEQLQEKYPTTGALIEEATPVSLDDQTIDLGFPEGFSYHRNKLSSSDRKEEVVEVVRHVYHHTFNVSFSVRNGGSSEKQKPDDDENEGTNGADEEDGSEPTSSSAPEEHPDVRKVMEFFDADIVYVEE